MLATPRPNHHSGLPQHLRHGSLGHVVLHLQLSHRRAGFVLGDDRRCLVGGQLLLRPARRSRRWRRLRLARSACLEASPQLSEVIEQIGPVRVNSRHVHQALGLKSQVRVLFSCPDSTPSGVGEHILSTLLRRQAQSSTHRGPDLVEVIPVQVARDESRGRSVSGPTSFHGCYRRRYSLVARSKRPISS